MSHVRLIPGLCALLASLGACSEHRTPAPAAAPAALPAAASTAAGEGPRIVMSDDNVHLEYHVLGHGD
ncbi:MAG: hypothetical protein WAK94_14055, partial [Steroidobacteraceae bacterium]